MLELLSYRFFVHALVAAFLTSVTCGIVGTYIVSRRIVFISGGISHASFGGIGIGYFLGINPIVSAAVFSVLSALGLQSLSHHSDIREDSLIGMTWSFGMALGIIFVFLTPGYAANLMSYLFGNILTVTRFDLWLMAGLGLLVLTLFSLLFKEILFVAFDAEFARTQGISVSLINYILAALVALTIVINIRVVGIILVLSLLTIPQATANLFTKSFKTMMLYSTGFGLAASLSGLLISYYLNIPSGATIIFVAIILFVLSKTIKMLLTKRKKRRA
jgi:zinc transport system permease protein